MIHAVVRYFLGVNCLIVLVASGAVKDRTIVAVVVGFIQGELTEAKIADIGFLLGVEETSYLVFREYVSLDGNHIVFLGTFLSQHHLTLLAAVIERDAGPEVLFLTNP